MDLRLRVESRHPHHFAQTAGRERHLLYRGRIHATHAQVEVDAAKHLNARHNFVDQVRDIGSRLVVILQHDRPHPAAFCQSRQINRVDAPRNRIGRSMRMNIDHAFERLHLCTTGDWTNSGKERERETDSIHECLPTGNMQIKRIRSPDAILAVRTFVGNRKPRPVQSTTRALEEIPAPQVRAFGPGIAHRRMICPDISEITYRCPGCSVQVELLDTKRRHATTPAAEYPSLPEPSEAGSPANLRPEPACGPLQGSRRQVQALHHLPGCPDARSGLQHPSRSRGCSIGCADPAKGCRRTRRSYPVAARLRLSSLQLQHCYEIAQRSREWF